MVLLGASGFIGPDILQAGRICTFSLTESPPERAPPKMVLVDQLWSFTHVYGTKQSSTLLKPWTQFCGLAPARPSCLTYVHLSVQPVSFQSPSLNLLTSGSSLFLSSAWRILHAAFSSTLLGSWRHCSSHTLAWLGVISVLALPCASDDIIVREDKLLVP